MFDPIAINVRATQHRPDGTYVLAVEMEGFVLILHQKIVEIDFEYDPKKPPKGTFGWDAKSITKAHTTVKTLSTQVIPVEDFRIETFVQPEKPARIEAPPMGLMIEDKTEWTLDSLRANAVAYRRQFAGFELTPYILKLYPPEKPCFMTTADVHENFNDSVRHSEFPFREAGFYVKTLKAVFPNRNPITFGLVFASIEDDFKRACTILEKELVTFAQQFVDKRI